MRTAHEELRPAFSRPGFLTFKRGEGELSSRFEPRCAFARISGLSLGRAEGPLAERARSFWEQAPTAVHLHLWARTQRLRRSEDPLQPTALEQAREALAAGAAERRLHVNQPARPGQAILDCVIVEPDQWWIGYREAVSPSSRWVGGEPPITPPPSMVSRAYLKMQEALLWSRLPLRPGQVFAEIGSAPGGSCQALLERRLQVIGVDPADMDPIVSAHPQFTHLRRRGVEVRRKDLAAAQWLSVDSNIAPRQTLEMLETLHEHEEVGFDGLLITLKMPDWDAADALPEHLRRIASWGYELVKPRHLFHNRQELCVLAVRRRSLLRKPRSKSGRKRPNRRGQS